jgi:hypothetical protein
MRLRKFPPGWPMICSGAPVKGGVPLHWALRWVSYSITSASWVPETGAEEALPWAAAAPLISGRFAVGGTVLVRKGIRRGWDSRPGRGSTACGATWRGRPALSCAAGFGSL